MATRSLDGRLAELEQKRDQEMDRLVDQYIAIEQEIYTPDELAVIRALNDADRDWPPDLVARWRADPRMQALDRVYGRFINWRQTVEHITNQKGPRSRP